MKRFLFLCSLCVAMARAEDDKLPKNVIMHLDKSLVSIKAGTVVQILHRDAKSITVKADGKVGTIPLDSFVPAAPEPVRAAVPVAAAPAVKAKPSPSPTVTASAPAEPAVSGYGKMVEKARQVTDQHEKAMVTPEDELLSKR